MLGRITAKERRTIGEIIRLTGLDERSALWIARLFEPYIVTAPGGFGGLYKAGPPGALSDAAYTGFLWDQRRHYASLIWPE